MKFTLLIVLALACGEVGALKCFFCNSVLSPNPDCENGPDRKYIIDCPAPPNGYVTRCSKLDGVVNVPLIGNLDDFERECTNWASNSVPENKCFVDNDATSLILQTVEPSIRPYLNGSFSFKGNLCVCDTDECNGVASTQPIIGMLVTTLGLYLIVVW